MACRAGVRWLWWASASVLGAMCAVGDGARAQGADGDLPDAPSAVLQATAQKMTATMPLCVPGRKTPPGQAPVPCIQPEERVQPIISRAETGPLTSAEKGVLAFKDFIDPFNLVTIAGYSAIAVGVNAHSAYGPGVKGWGKLTGYGLAEDAQGEFFGTFVLPVAFHQDPRYRRQPGKPVGRRLLHAIAHTVVSQHDDGRAMPNFATLLNYPISAELSNLYVPGVQTNAADTAQRIAVGLATNPVGDIVAEFLPDVARRIHVRVIFVQEIVNQVATGGSAPNVM